MRPQCSLGAVTPVRTAGLNRLEQPVFPKYLVRGNHVYPIGTVRFGWPGVEGQPPREGAAGHWAGVENKGPAPLLPVDWKACTFGLPGKTAPRVVKNP